MTRTTERVAGVGTRVAHPTILLSEGSSLSAREAVSTLGLSGHLVDLCAPTTWCLCRLSRWVRQVHRAPGVAVDPAGYVEAVARLCDAHRYDVLLPVHEQAYLFSALRASRPDWPDRRTAVPVASFAAFEALQTKVALATTLDALGLRQPATFIARTAQQLNDYGRDLLRSARACVVKVPSGTASTGVHCVRDRHALEMLCVAWSQVADAPTDAGRAPMVVQELVDGPVERVQTVFAHGRLVAVHCYRQLLEGPGGGDVLKESVRRPAVVDHMSKLGAHLDWHGALAFDYIFPSDISGPCYIDANPRLVEPMNAYLGGVDLAGSLLRVALDEDPGPLQTGIAGVRTRLGIPGLIERATHGGRLGVLRDLVAQIRGTGRYVGAAEELTPSGDDWRSIVPWSTVAMSLLAQPSAATRMTRDTIDAYALGDRGYRFAHSLGAGP